MGGTFGAGKGLDFRQMLPLDLSSFRNAIGQLAEGLEVLEAQPQNTLLRDGVIQRFEFTYELSHKMLKRYIESAAASPGEVDAMSFPALIRTGSEQGLLLSGWDKWQVFRQARSITSHTYDQTKSLEVLRIVPEFLREAQFLLAKLEKRNG